MPLITDSSLGLPCLSGPGKWAAGRETDRRTPTASSAFVRSISACPSVALPATPLLENSSLASLLPRRPPRLQRTGRHQWHSLRATAGAPGWHGRPLCPARTPCSSRIAHALRSDTLISSFQEGWCQLSRCPSRTRGLFYLSLVAAVFPSLPVSISAWH